MYLTMLMKIVQSIQLYVRINGNWNVDHIIICRTTHKINIFLIFDNYVRIKFHFKSFKYKRNIINIGSFQYIIYMQVAYYKLCKSYHWLVIRTYISYIHCAKIQTFFSDEDEMNNFFLYNFVSCIDRSYAGCLLISWIQVSHTSYVYLFFSHGNSMSTWVIMFLFIVTYLYTSLI